MAKSKPKSPFIGHWRIVSMAQWDQEVIDEEEEGHFEFDDKGGGEFHFGYVQGQMDCKPTTRDGEPAVEWTWDGHDEMDPAQGRGWAVIRGVELHGAIFFHRGDDSTFVAKRPEVPRLETKPDHVALYPVNLGIAQRRVVAEIIPGLTARMKLDEPKQRTIEFTVAELKAIRKMATSGMRNANTGSKRTSLRHVADLTAKALDRSQGIGSIPTTVRLYQFKIALKEAHPPIWRRIQVKDCTLDKLHEHIQTAMGWTNSHLHRFKIDGVEYGDPTLLSGDPAFEFEDSTSKKFGDVLPKTGERYRFEYEYDFGDSWFHEVVFEGCVRASTGCKYPLCLEGSRACPPEDVDGVRGYEDYLEAIVDPEHERHQELTAWNGPFDPEAFDAAKVTKRMQRGLPDWKTESDSWL